MTGAILLGQILFLLSMIVQSWPHQNLYYVKMLGSQCPNNTAYVECQTLAWYCENVTQWIKNDTMLLFQEGVHSLDGLLMVNYSNNLDLSGEGNVSMSINGLPEPTTKINCTPNSGLHFSRSAIIHLHNLHFESCGGIYYFDKKHRRGTDQCRSGIAFSARHAYLVQTAIQKQHQTDV